MKQKKGVVNKRLVSSKLSSIKEPKAMLIPLQISEPGKKPHILHRIKHNVFSLHRIRKLKEDNLQPWKQKWHDWNEKHFGWLEHLVDVMIPYLVILLLFILIGEFADKINFFHWQFMDNLAKLFEERKPVVDFIDGIIVVFFVIDLYFNFFKKRKIWTFIKTSILDIIAIMPLGLIFRALEIYDIQGVFHVIGEIGKESAKIAEAIPKIVKLHRLTDLKKNK